MFRNWLCSVSRVGPAQRDRAPSRSVSGVPASPAANRSTLALFCLPGKVAGVGPQFPPGQFFSASKIPKTVSMLTVLLGEILYFQPPASQKRRHPYGLASFRPSANTAFAQHDTLPAFRAILHRLEPGASSGGLLPAQIHANPRRQPYPLETKSVYANPPESPSFPTIRETHLAKNPLQMRLPISSHHRNPLKKKESTASQMTTPHTRTRCVTRSGLLGRADRCRSPMFPEGERFRKYGCVSCGGAGGAACPRPSEARRVPLRGTPARAGGTACPT